MVIVAIHLGGYPDIEPEYKYERYDAVYAFLLEDFDKLVGDERIKFAWQKVDDPACEARLRAKKAAGSEIPSENYKVERDKDGHTIRQSSVKFDLDRVQAAKLSRIDSSTDKSPLLEVDEAPMTNKVG